MPSVPDRTPTDPRCRSRFRRGRPAPFLVVLGGLAAAAPAAAQEPAGAVRFVRPGHPACALALRAWAAGGTVAGMPTFGTRTLALDDPGAEPLGPVRKALADELRNRPLAAGGHLDLATGATLAAATIDVGVPGAPEYVYPGHGYDVGREGSPGLRASLGRGPFLVGVEARPSRDRRAFRAAVGVAGEAGRLVAGFLDARAGPTCADGLVLGGRGVFRGFEAVQGRPWHLPVVGAIRIGTQVGILDEAGPGNDHPFFHAMRVELSPSPSVTVGLSRAVVFGGSATAVPVTPHTVALLLAGLTDAPGKDSDFENQVAAVDVRLRARLGDRPLLATFEYGADDSGRAFLVVPGLRGTASVEIGSGGPWLGVDLVRVAGSDDGHPPWYRHGALAWGWTERGLPLGSPLGGHGWAVLATASSAAPGRVVEAGLGLVRRGHENLFVPALLGWGVRAQTSVLVHAGPWEVAVDGALDRAPTWAGRLALSLAWRFGLP